MLPVATCVATQCQWVGRHLPACAPAATQWQRKALSGTEKKRSIRGWIYVRHLLLNRTQTRIDMHHDVVATTLDRKSRALCC